MIYEACIAGGKGNNSFSFQEKVNAKSMSEAVKKIVNKIEEWKKVDGPTRLPFNSEVVSIERIK